MELPRWKAGSKFKVMGLSEIKSAIEALTEKERCELNAWLQNWEPDDWDRRMEADARSGEFDALIREGEAAHRKGESRPFP
jgi:hypothetical protein